MKTSIILGVLTLALSTIFTLTTKAQETITKATTTGSGIRLSIGPDATLPVGSLHDGYNWSIGGSIQADFPVIKDQLFVTVNAGYSNYFAKDSNLPGVDNKDLQLIPVKAGLKYFPVHNFYLQGEAGASFIANKSDIGADKSAAFVYAPQVGYLISLGGKNYLDAGVRFESNTKFVTNGNTNNFFGLRVAYAFGL
ncbi:porin family protein [Mucilaginibacter agri]|nr:porin family protein [Mucilaginibacter agri]